MEASPYQPITLEQKRRMPVFAALISVAGLSGSSWHQAQPATAAVERCQTHSHALTRTRMHTILPISPSYHCGGFNFFMANKM